MFWKQIRNSLRYAVLACLVIATLAASEHRGIVRFGGLPVPGAAVTLTQGDKKLSAVTDDQGIYVFPDVADGIWSIQIEMLCFEPIKNEVGISANAPPGQWELKLQPFDQIKASAPPPSEPSTPAPTTTTAPAATTAAAAPAPPTTKKSNTRGKNAAAAPAPTGQNFQRADVNASGDGAKPPADAAAAGSVNELAPANSDGFLINGSVNNGAASPFAQNAAFGNNRRGPRSLYNGNLGFVIDNSALDARPFSLTGQSTPKAAYNHLQGMASYGGPLKLPNKPALQRTPNFTVNYQFQRSRTATTSSTLMPTAAERAGDFSAIPISIFDPTTGQPFPNNVIPTSRISPQAAALLGFYPNPNFTPLGRYNYQVPIVGTSDADNVQARVNKTINNKNQVNGIFAF